MIRLADLDDCFEGVIPSVVATGGADGLPNISYLSHVTRVDDDHIALSNQFFGKTAANLRRNPCATILLVDGRTGAQVRAEAIFVRSETEGVLFDRVAAQLAASAAQVGMEATMQLRAVDVFRVLSLQATPTQAPVPPADRAIRPELSALARAVAAIDVAPDLGGACEAALDAATALLGADAAMILMRDHPREVLMTVLSRGYETGGAGAEVPFGIGAIGIAAATRQVIRGGDLGLAPVPEPGPGRRQVAGPERAEAGKFEADGAARQPVLDDRSAVGAARHVAAGAIHDAREIGAARDGIGGFGVDGRRRGDERQCCKGEDPKGHLCLHERAGAVPSCRAAGGGRAWGRRRGAGMS